MQITPVGIANLGWRFYIIWAIFNAIFVPVSRSYHNRRKCGDLIRPAQLVYLVYPETANRHLEDIDKLYREGESTVFVFRNKEATQVERPQRFIDADQERLDMLARLARETEIMDADENKDDSRE